MAAAADGKETAPLGGDASDSKGVEVAQPAGDAQRAAIDTETTGKNEDTEMKDAAADTAAGGEDKQDVKKPDGEQHLQLDDACPALISGQPMLRHAAISAVQSGVWRRVAHLRARQSIAVSIAKFRVALMAWPP